MSQVWIRSAKGFELGVLEEHPESLPSELLENQENRGPCFTDALPKDSKRSVRVRLSSGLIVEQSASNIFAADSTFGHKDNTALTFLTAPNLLENVCHRYEQTYTNAVTSQGKIYSFTGWVLVSVNPCRPLPALYGDDVLQQYFNKGRSISSMEPHPFAIAEAAYSSMLKDWKSQSVVISGESGAGKTESSKHVLKYLACISDRRHESRNRGIEHRVLQTNPILEAFGNAKTVRNHNSSRFGKLMKLHFNRSGRMVGASIQTYLLAKSRVCHVPPQEQNYHIFYWLCRGARVSERELWGLGDAAQYRYLLACDVIAAKPSGAPRLGSQVGSVAPTGTTSQLQDVRNAMDGIGMSNSMQREIFRVLVAILTLGNIVFKVGDREGQKGVALIDNISEARQAALLLGLEGDEGYKQFELAVTSKTVRDIRVFVSDSVARQLTDALARALYQQIFDFLVRQINRSLAVSTPPPSIARSTDSSIGKAANLSTPESTPTASRRLYQQCQRGSCKAPPISSPLSNSSLSPPDDRCVKHLPSKGGTVEGLDADVDMYSSNRKQVEGRCGPNRHVTGQMLNETDADMECPSQTLSGRVDSDGDSVSRGAGKTGSEMGHESGGDFGMLGVGGGGRDSEAFETRQEQRTSAVATLTKAASSCRRSRWVRSSTGRYYQRPADDQPDSEMRGRLSSNSKDASGNSVSAENCDGSAGRPKRRKRRSISLTPLPSDSPNDRKETLSSGGGGESAGEGATMDANEDSVPVPPPSCPPLTNCILRIPIAPGIPKKGNLDKKNDGFGIPLASTTATTTSLAGATATQSAAGLTDLGQPTQRLKERGRAAAGPAVSDLGLGHLKPRSNSVIGAAGRDNARQTWRGALAGGYHGGDDDSELDTVTTTGSSVIEDNDSSEFPDSDSESSCDNEEICNIAEPVDDGGVCDGSAGHLNGTRTDFSKLKDNRNQGGSSGMLRGRGREVRGHRVQKRRAVALSRFIGVLDIFGFENLLPFCPNNFEQLCVNYANEKLHNFFIEQLVRRECDLYVSEGLIAPEIEWVDNDAICLTIAGTKQRPGIFELLDEASSIPVVGSKDEYFCQKVNTQLFPDPSGSQSPSVGNSSCLVPQRRGRDSSRQFVIRHFAGDVCYAAEGFSQKNVDVLSRDLLNFLPHCGSFITSQLLRLESRRQQASTVSSALISNTTNTTIVANGGVSKCGRPSTMKTNAFGSRTVGSINGGGTFLDGGIPRQLGNPSSGLDYQTVYGTTSSRSSRRLQQLRPTKSLASLFSNQVERLMLKLKKTSSFFIRCIKPNDLQRPYALDRRRVCQQLETGGLLSVLKLMSLGYPCRVPYVDLWNRYSDVLPPMMKSMMTPADFAEIMLMFLGTARTDFALGNTKAFFRFGALQAMEKVTAMTDEATRKEIADTTYHFWFKKRRLRLFATVRCGVLLWLSVRRDRSRRLAAEAVIFYNDVLFPKICNRLAIKIQRTWRGVYVRKCLAYQSRLEAASLAIQTAWKGHFCRQHIRSLISASSIVQSFGRLVVARDSFTAWNKSRYQAAARVIQTRWRKHREQVRVEKEAAYRLEQQQLAAQLLKEQQQQKEEEERQRLQRYAHLKQESPPPARRSSSPSRLQKLQAGSRLSKLPEDLTSAQSQKSEEGLHGDSDSSCEFSAETSLEPSERAASVQVSLCDATLFISESQAKASNSPYDGNCVIAPVPAPMTGGLLSPSASPGVDGASARRSIERLAEAVSGARRLSNFTFSRRSTESDALGVFVDGTSCATLIEPGGGGSASPLPFHTPFLGISDEGRGIDAGGGDGDDDGDRGLALVTARDTLLTEKKAEGLCGRDGKGSRLTLAHNKRGSLDHGDDQRTAADGIVSGERRRQSGGSVQRGGQQRSCEITYGGSPDTDRPFHTPREPPTGYPSLSKEGGGSTLRDTLEMPQRGISHDGSAVEWKVGDGDSGRAAEGSVSFGVYKADGGWYPRPRHTAAEKSAGFITGDARLQGQNIIRGGDERLVSSSEYDEVARSSVGNVEGGLEVLGNNGEAIGAAAVSSVGQIREPQSDVGGDLGNGHPGRRLRCWLADARPRGAASLSYSSLPLLHDGDRADDFDFDCYVESRNEANVESRKAKVVRMPFSVAASASALHRREVKRRRWERNAFSMPGEICGGGLSHAGEVVGGDSVQHSYLSDAAADASDASSFAQQASDVRYLREQPYCGNHLLPLHRPNALASSSMKSFSLPETPRLTPWGPSSKRRRRYICNDGSFNLNESMLDEECRPSFDNDDEDDTHNGCNRNVDVCCWPQGGDGFCQRACKATHEQRGEKVSTCGHHLCIHQAGRLCSHINDSVYRQGLEYLGKAFKCFQTLDIHPEGMLGSFCKAASFPEKLGSGAPRRDSLDLGSGAGANRGSLGLPTPSFSYREAVDNGSQACGQVGYVLNGSDTTKSFRKDLPKDKSPAFGGRSLSNSRKAVASPAPSFGDATIIHDDGGMCPTSIYEYEADMNSRQPLRESISAKEGQPEPPKQTMSDRCGSQVDSSHGPRGLLQQQPCRDETADGCSPAMMPTSQELPIRRRRRPTVILEPPSSANDEASEVQMGDRGAEAVQVDFDGLERRSRGSIGMAAVEGNGRSQQVLLEGGRKSPVERPSLIGTSPSRTSLGVPDSEGEFLPRYESHYRLPDDDLGVLEDIRAGRRGSVLMAGLVLGMADDDEAMATLIGDDDEDDELSDTFDGLKKKKREGSLLQGKQRDRKEDMTWVTKRPDRGERANATRNRDSIDAATASSVSSAAELGRSHSPNSHLARTQVEGSGGDASPLLRGNRLRRQEQERKWRPSSVTRQEQGSPLSKPLEGEAGVTDRGQDCGYSSYTLPQSNAAIESGRSTDARRLQQLDLQRGAPLPVSQSFSRIPRPPQIRRRNASTSGGYPSRFSASECASDGGGSIAGSEWWGPAYHDTDLTSDGRRIQYSREPLISLVASSGANRQGSQAHRRVSSASQFDMSSYRSSITSVAPRRHTRYGAQPTSLTSGTRGLPSGRHGQCSSQSRTSATVDCGEIVYQDDNVYDVSDYDEAQKSGQHLSGGLGMYHRSGFKQSPHGNVDIETMGVAGDMAHNNEDDSKNASTIKAAARRCRSLRGRENNNSEGHLSPSSTGLHLPPLGRRPPLHRRPAEDQRRHRLLYRPMPAASAGHALSSPSPTSYAGASANRVVSEAGLPYPSKAAHSLSCGDANDEQMAHSALAYRVAGNCAAPRDPGTYVRNGRMPSAAPASPSLQAAFYDGRTILQRRSQPSQISTDDGARQSLSAISSRAYGDEEATVTSVVNCSLGRGRNTYQDGLSTPEHHERHHRRTCSQIGVQERNSVGHSRECSEGPTYGGNRRSNIAGVDGGTSSSAMQRASSRHNGTSAGELRGRAISDTTPAHHNHSLGYSGGSEVDRGSGLRADGSVEHRRTSGGKSKDDTWSDDHHAKLFKQPLPLRLKDDCLSKAGVGSAARQIPRHPVRQRTTAPSLPPGGLIEHSYANGGFANQSTILPRPDFALQQRVDNTKPITSKIRTSSPSCRRALLSTPQTPLMRTSARSHQGVNSICSSSPHASQEGSEDRYQQGRQ